MNQTVVEFNKKLDKLERLLLQMNYQMERLCVTLKSMVDYQDALAKLVGTEPLELTDEEWDALLGHDEPPQINLIKDIHEAWPEDWYLRKEPPF